MGRVPEQAIKKETTISKKETPKAEKKVEPKKPLNCFVMPDRPTKPGLLLVSTSKTQDGCFVLGWQEQSATWLVSEGTQWYAFSSKLLKVNLAAISVFAIALLLVLWLTRRVR